MKIYAAKKKKKRKGRKGRDLEEGLYICESESHNGMAMFMNMNSEFLQSQCKQSSTSLSLGVSILVLNFLVSEIAGAFTWLDGHYTVSEQNSPWHGEFALQFIVVVFSLRQVCPFSDLCLK